MINESTINKLIEMHLTAMADAFRIQQNDKSMKEVSFEDRFGMLVDAEYISRKNNRLKRLIHTAGFEQPDACIAGIDYTSGRKLNRDLINRLASCEYIPEYRNIFITGATGSGKTYMACAFGMEACKHYYRVRFVRLPDLLLELQAAREDGVFQNVLKKYTNAQIASGEDKRILLNFAGSIFKQPENYTYAVGNYTKTVKTGYRTYTSYYYSYLLAFNQAELHVISFKASNHEPVYRNIMTFNVLLSF